MQANRRDSSSKVDLEIGPSQVIEECIAVLDLLEPLPDTAFVKWLRGRMTRQLDKVWESSALDADSCTKRESMKELRRIKYWMNSYADQVNPGIVSHDNG